jgi:tetratricopeptide (TPR) repeat protein
MKDISQASSRGQALSAAAVTVLAGRLGADALVGREVEELVPHARALLDEPRSAAELDLLNAVARYDLDRGAAGAAEAHFRQEHTARERLFGAEDRSTLRALSGVADAVGRQGDPHRARELQDVVLAARTRVYGSDDDETLAAMAALAESIRNDAEFARAMEMSRAVLEARHRLCDPDDPRILDAKAALALDLGHGGFPAEAQELLEDVVERRLCVLGPAHPDTIKARMNLVVSVAIAGDLDRARELAEAVAEASEQAMGAEHPMTLHALSQLAGMDARSELATVLADDGDFEGARARLESVLEIRTRRFGRRNGPTLTVMALLGQVLAAEGDLKGATRTLKMTRRLTRATFGASHPRTQSLTDMIEAVRAERRARRSFYVRLTWR